MSPSFCEKRCPGVRLECDLRDPRKQLPCPGALRSHLQGPWFSATSHPGLGVSRCKPSFNSTSESQQDKVSRKGTLGTQGDTIPQQALDTRKTAQLFRFQTTKIFGLGSIIYLQTKRYCLPGQLPQGNYFSCTFFFSQPEPRATGKSQFQQAVSHPTAGGGSPPLLCLAAFDSAVGGGGGGGVEQCLGWVFQKLRRDD